ncbi:MAG: queuosine precursor transporter [Flavobacteriaceae bacterium]
MTLNLKNSIYFLVFVHVVITTLSNALVAIPLTIYGYKITWAAFSFPLVVVATDLTVRLLGKSIAQKTIAYSYPLAILSSVFIVYFEGNLLSVALRIGMASATAYALGVIIDIHAFQLIRERYSSWWTAPALSTVLSNVIDSYVFFSTAFFESDDSYMASNWIEIAGTQTVLKIIIGLIFFLPIYGILLNYLSKRVKVD